MGERVNFDYLPRKGWGGGTEKFKKGAGSSLLFLHLGFTLPFAKFCYVFEKNCFCHHNFMKKCHSKLSKKEPENISKIKISYL